MTTSPAASPKATPRRCSPSTPTRRSTQTTTDPSGTTRTTRKYTDDSDNPAWAETTTPDGSTSTTRFTESLGGDLSATINDDGGLSLSLANPHGDIVTTVEVPAAQAADTAATSITGWASYDEYGNQNNPAATDQVDGPLGYGWLGAKQRSTTSATAGLTLMGVRYYNAVRGLFTSLDPGGNDTAYTYPSDPINQYDLDGRQLDWKGSEGGGAGGTKAPPVWKPKPKLTGTGYKSRQSAKSAAKSDRKALTRGSQKAYLRGPCKNDICHVDIYRVKPGKKAPRKTPGRKGHKNLIFLGTRHYRLNRGMK